MPAFFRPALLLFALVVLAALPQAALLPLLDRDEPRFAEASREMVESHNFVVPTFNYAPRYAKPPLIYWCQAACFEIFGENAFAARLPSLLAVAGTALLLLTWGRALGSHEAGLIAALAYAFCLQVMQQGRVATADALLIFFMTLTAFAGWRMLDLVRTGLGSWNLWGVILALGFAGGFLAKGPEALLPIVPIVIAARWMGWRGIASFLLIFALGLLAVTAWAVPAYVQTHGDYWREGLGHDVGDRMVTGFQGHGASTLGSYLLTLPFYFLIFWLSALPWSPLLALNARRLIAAAPADWTDRYLLVNAALVFTVFTLAVTKLPHYTLPAFPFLALVFGRRWIAANRSLAFPLRLLLAFGIVLGLLALLIITTTGRNGWTPSPVGILIEKAELDRSLPDRVDVPAMSFALVDFQEPNAIWEIRRSVEPWMIKKETTGGVVEAVADDQVLIYLRKPGPRAVVLSAGLWDRLKMKADFRWHTYEARGLNAARPLNFRGLAWPKIRPVELTLVIKPASKG
jgi:4-amino-4-deoxy-L-arabinose transferase-like glycosyltransferase